MQDEGEFHFFSLSLCITKEKEYVYEHTDFMLLYAGGMGICIVCVCADPFVRPAMSGRSQLAGTG